MGKRAAGIRIRFENGAAVIEAKGSRYPPHVRHIAKELLAQGLSLNAVSRQTGVDVGVLSRVRRGEFWANDEYGAVETLGRKHRCATCGAMVFGNCLACQISDALHRSHGR